MRKVSYGKKTISYDKKRNSETTKQINLLLINISELQYRPCKKETGHNGK